ncbi:hypothetical protein AAG906_016951 [Vitis piasezkii]
MWKSGCEPDVATYMILIRSLCNAQKADIALEFYKEMVHKEMGLDMSLYELLLICLAGCGDIVGVQLVANDMIRRFDTTKIVDIMKKRKVIDAKVYGIIIGGYLRRNDIPKAFDPIEKLQAIDEMLEIRVEPDSVVITTMVAGHVRQNHIFEGHRATWKSYSMFIKELYKISRTIRLSRKRDGSSHTIETYNIGIKISGCSKILEYSSHSSYPPHSPLL